MTGFIRALASLAWPLLVAGFVWFYRAEIRDVLRRLSHIKRGEILGQKFELEETLTEFEASAEQAQQDVAATTPIVPPAIQSPSSEGLEAQLLRDATKSPKLSLMLLSAEIDRRLRQLLAATGWQANIRATPLTTAVEKLRAQGSLPEHVSGSVKLFQTVRNQIIHGGTAEEAEILRAIDSGFTLLRAIDAIPAETNVVHRIDVPLYSDPACATLVPNVRGLILEVTSPGGSQKSFRIVPTRGNFQLGRRMTWEWNLENTWPAAWFRDPDSGEIKEAWISSAEFVGRPVDDV